MLKRGSTPSYTNAALAYEFWSARCFRDELPEEDLFRAVYAKSTNKGDIKLKSERHRRSSRKKAKP